MPSPRPKHAKIAVTLTFDFDAESGWLSRDPALKDRPGIMSQGCRAVAEHWLARSR